MEPSKAWTDKDSFLIVSWLWSDTNRREKSGTLKSLLVSVFNLKYLNLKCLKSLVKRYNFMYLPFKDYSTGTMQKGFESFASSVARNSPNFVGFLTLI